MSSIDLVALPKAELHVHLEATLADETAVELAREHEKPLPRTEAGDDLSQFVKTYEQARDLIVSLDVLHRVAREFGERQTRLGVVWSEVYFIPSTYGGRLGDERLLIETVMDGLQSGAGSNRAGLILGINRGLPHGEAMRAVRLAAASMGDGVVALGLAGDEANFPARLFEDVFAYGQSHGLKAVPHSGEASGPGGVREALELLKPTRISHGFQAAPDARLVQELADRQICLDLAPSSNVMLGGVAEFSQHPLPELMAAGVPLTLNSDAPFFTRGDLVDEYRRCITEFRLSNEEVFRLARNSIDHSFCPPEIRSAALAGIAALERE